MLVSGFYFLSTVIGILVTSSIVSRNTDVEDTLTQ